LTGPLEERLAAVPRVSLTRADTPLQELGNLSRELGIRVALKRDDLTDLALGGDKPRKLEYELARAVEAGADTIVACGSSQSNFARLVTAAARRLGMSCELVLSRGHHPETQGNLLAIRLMGAGVRLVDIPDIWELESSCLALVGELRAAGRRPYYVPVSGTTPASCLGYVRAGFELAGQLEALGMRPAALYTPFGTGGIFAGLYVALRERGVTVPMVGISVNRDRAACEDLLRRRLEDIAGMLDVAPLPVDGGVELRDDQLGAGYGHPTDACLDAIVTFARAEGVLLDPVYSGKVGAGVLADARAGRWPRASTVLMLHSGGVPAIFAYHDELVTHLERHPPA
jgi:1-aminocyclopropane-1-carboxylate deaminase/D-cysteine desulfhydrase-like pyridoxal-dependent ACC family enzyme